MQSSIEGYLIWNNYHKDGNQARWMGYRNPAYDEAVMNASTTTDAFTQWGDTEWDAYRDSVVIPASAEVHKPGHYAAEVRRQRRGQGCPFAAMAAAREAAPAA